MLTSDIGDVRSQDAANRSHFPAANTAAIITINAVEGRRHNIRSIQWSYSAAPTGGRITVTSGGVTIFDIDISSGGPGGFTLFLMGGVNEQVIITLAAGAGTVVGKLNAQTTSMGA